MSKQKKKRNKRYHGEDAAAPVSTQPVVHRYSAVDRGPVSQWWFEKKKPVILGAKVTSVAAIVGWLIYELFQIIL